MIRDKIRFSKNVKLENNFFENLTLSHKFIVLYMHFYLFHSNMFENRKLGENSSNLWEETAK